MNTIINNSSNSDKYQMNIVPKSRFRFSPKLILNMDEGSCNVENFLFQELIQSKTISIKIYQLNFLGILGQNYFLFIQFFKSSKIQMLELQLNTTIGFDSA